jgi:sensor histidine kinase regulating citrate/malate metabolism
MQSSIVFILALTALLVSIQAGIILKNKHDSALNIGARKLFGDSFKKAQDAPEQWFTQNVDHFDQQNTETYQQRYYVNDTLYKPGGPVFFLLGGEGK